MTKLVAGFGCRQGCSVAVLGALLDQTLALHQLDRRVILGLASLDLKYQEPGLLQLAEQLGLALQSYSAAHLLDYEARLSQRSALAFAHTGCYGVAESSALALAEQFGQRGAVLHTPRQVLQGATLALAWVP